MADCRRSMVSILMATSVAWQWLRLFAILAILTWSIRRISMATATLRNRRKKTDTCPPIVDDELEESSAFFMPAGSMSLSEFREWTYSDRFPKTGLIAYIGKEIFV